MPPIIDFEKCNCCGICVNICPEDVFFGSEKKKVPVVTYPDECWHCNACVYDCTSEGAISIRVPLPMMVVYKPSD